MNQEGNESPSPSTTPKPTKQDPPKKDPPKEEDCEPKPCEPTLVPMTLEIEPVITLCVKKPSVTLKNNAVCICTPCKSEK